MRFCIFFSSFLISTQNNYRCTFSNSKEVVVVGLGRLELPTSPLSGVLLFRKIPYYRWVSEQRYFYCVPFCVPLVQQLCIFAQFCVPKLTWVSPQIFLQTAAGWIELQLISYAPSYVHCICVLSSILASSEVVVRRILKPLTII